MYKKKKSLLKSYSTNAKNSLFTFFLLSMVFLWGNTTGYSQMVITDITPNAAAPGSNVTIYGVGFSATATENIVKFDSVTAIVQSALSNKLTVSVPETTPGFKNLIVTVETETAQYAGDFSVLTPTQIAFEDAISGLTGVRYSSSSFADVDGDGDLDLIITGYNDTTNTNTSTLYLNDGNGSFSDSGVALKGVHRGSSSFGDVDGDGGLDLLITGYYNSWMTSDLYLNDGNGGFSDSGVVLEGVLKGSSSFGDVDGDGDLDLVITGDNGSTFSSILYFNDGNGNFSDSGVALEGVYESSSSFGDVDGDGDLDLIITGQNSSYTFTSTIYINDGNGSFSDSGVALEGVNRGSSSFGDVDGDGDLDLVITGYNGSSQTSTLYLNDGNGNFSDSGVAAEGVYQSSSSFGDVDGDGDLDLVITGNNGSSKTSTLYLNDGNGNFSNPGITLEGVERGSSSFGDIDGDGDLDLLITGQSSSEATSILYKNIEPPLTTITDISPNAAAPGSNITIHGVGFSPTPSENTVTFGNTEATVVSSGANKIVVTVPNNSPGFAEISVTTSGSTADYAGSFSVLAPKEVYFKDASAALEGVRYSSSSYGDVDGDGDLDLIITGQSSSGYISTLYLNDGNGGFTDSGVALEEVWMASSSLGDVDGDGDLDLIITGDKGSSVYISILYLNDGNGGFSDSGIALEGISQGSSSFGDVDGDGDLDLIITGQSSAEPISTLYLNDGNGGFLDSGVAIEGVSQSSSSFGDVNGNGHLDLIITGSNGSTNTSTLYLNDGNGGFSASGVALEGIWLGSSSFGDVDSDGDPDLIITGHSSSFGPINTLYLNDGNGGFSDSGVALEGVSQSSSSFGDVDGNGHLDLIINGQSSSEYISTLYLNDGSGGFFDSGIDLEGVRIGFSSFGDINGDGDLDLLINGENNSGQYISRIYDNAIPPFGISSVSPNSAAPGTNVTLYGAGFYTNAAENTVSFGNTNATIVSADTSKLVVTVPNITRGFSSISVSNANGSTDYSGDFTVLNTQKAHFGGQEIVTTSASGARDVYSADLDGDGDKDILSASELDDEIAWYENYGDGTFADKITISTLTDGAKSVFATDLDGDGYQDVLSASSGDDKIAWYTNNGDGTFGDQIVISTLADGARQVYAADLDGDGDQDVISASYDDDKIAWYQNDGNGTFGEQNVISSFSDGASSIYAIDLDNDGDQDIISASVLDDEIAWFKNNGDGTFTAQMISTQANGAKSIYAADFNGNGLLDIIYASNLDDKIAWYANNGDGTFATETIISTTVDGAEKVYATDLDGDGDQDIVTASITDNKVSWFPGNGDGTFGERVIVSTLVQGLNGIFASDLDGDGNQDILSASYFDGGKIAWYKNIGPQNPSLVSISTARQTSNGEYVRVRGVVTRTMGGSTTLQEENDAIHIFAPAGMPFYDAILNDEVAPGDSIEIIGELADFNGLKEIEHIYSYSVLSRDNPLPAPSQITLSQVGEGYESELVRIEGLSMDSAGRPFQYLTSYNISEEGSSSTLELRIPGVNETEIGDSFIPRLFTFEGVVKQFTSTGSNGYQLVPVYEGDIIPQQVFSISKVFPLSGAPGTEVTIFGNQFSDFGPDNTVSFGAHTATILSADSTRLVIRVPESIGPGTINTISVSNDNGSAEYPEIFTVLKKERAYFEVPNLVSEEVNGAQSVYSVDLNKDHKKDLLVAAYDDDIIYWLPNNGDETFGEQVTIASSLNGVYDVSSADINGDGHPDVLTASYFDDTIAWFFNDGEGNFGSRNIITNTADGAYSAYAADMDNDGDLDVVTASHLDDTIAWYENNGTGNFATKHVIPTLADGAHRTYAADLDNDGSMEVISASYNSDKIEWYKFNDSTWVANELTATADGARDVFATDLDGDGNLDILTASYLDDTIAWYLNNGDGSFGLTKNIISDSLQGAYSVYSVDMDGDGDMDVLAASDLDDTISLFENNGDGTFRDQRVISNAANGARSVFAADFDNDGDLDPISASYNDDKVALYLSTSHPVPTNLQVKEEMDSIVLTWTASSGPDVGGYNIYRSTETIADTSSELLINSELITDTTFSDIPPLGNRKYYYSITAVDSLSGDISELSNEVSIGYQLKSLYSIYPATGFPGDSFTMYGTNLSSTTADLSVTVGGTEATVSASTINSITISIPDISPGVYPLSISIHDTTDLPFAGLLTVIENTPEESGYFKQVEILSSSLIGLTGIEAADLDSDNDYDILTTMFNATSAANVGWFDNSSSDPFSTLSTIGVEGNVGARDAASADFDGDGDLDVVAVYDQSVNWYENNGSGTFSTASSSTIEELPSNTNNIYSVQTVLAFDIDLDGDVDVLRAHAVDNEIVWYKNNGNGVFSDPQIISTQAGNVQDLLSVNVDNDSDLDLLAANPGGNSIDLYINQGDGTFASPTQITTTNGANKISSADIDGNGNIDIISASSTNNNIVWYPNNGDGTFSSDSSIISLENTFDVKVADLDGDGDLDITASTNTGMVLWYSNDGQSNFNTADTLTTSASGETVIQIADVTGNGTLDILAGSFATNELLLFKNVDTPPAPPTGLTISHGIGSATLSWDANSEPDIIGYDVLRASGSEEEFTSLLTDFQESTTFTDTGLQNGRTYYYKVVVYDLSLNPGQSEIVDIIAISTQISGITPEAGTAGTEVKLSGVGFSNVLSQNTVAFNDTEVDVLEADSLSLVIEVPTGLSGMQNITVTSEGIEYAHPSPFLIIIPNDGEFSIPQTQTDIGGLGNMVSADVEHDGDMDLLVAQPESDRLTLYLSDNRDAFSSSTNFTYSGVSPKAVRSMNVGGNNYPDFVFISQLNNEFRVMKNTGLETTSTDLFTSHTISVNNTTPEDLSVADMDNDGKSDVIIASSGDAKISWHKNLSMDDDITFDAGNTITESAEGVVSIFSADFNNDRFIDILSANTDDVVLYQNNNDGTFSSSIIRENATPVKVFAADLNNDGFMDIISACSNGIFVNYNNGEGGFEDSINLDSNETSDIFAADLNGDGLMDILATFQPTDTVVWFLNEGDGNFSDARLISKDESGAINVIAYDMQGNGLLDIAARSIDQGKISVFRNMQVQGLVVSDFNAGNNNIILTTDEVEVQFNSDLSTISDFQSLITNAINIKNNNGDIFTPTVSVDGSSLIIGQNSIYAADTLFIEISSEQLRENSLGEFYVDVNNNGERYDSDNFYFSPDFHTGLIGDFTRDFYVDFDDLVLFRDGWFNNESSFETAPLVYGGRGFPSGRVNSNNTFNIDDLVNFIRYWNLSQDLRAKEMTKEIAAKANAENKEPAGYENPRKGSLKNSGNNPDLIKQNKSTADNNISEEISDSLRYISYSKEKIAEEFSTSENEPEVTYTFTLSHPDSVKALSLGIEYDQEKVEITGIKDHDLFEMGKNSNVFISHNDSVNGKATINLANFGTLTPIYDKKIVSVTFKSLMNQDSDIIITADLRAQGKPDHIQTAKKSVQVLEDLPQSFALSQNYPNPFNPTTTIHYELAEQARVSLDIYDLLGRRVETLINQNDLKAGYYKTNWDASRYASGMYIYVLNINSRSGKTHMLTKKMMMIK